MAAVFQSFFFAPSGVGRAQISYFAPSTGEWWISGENRSFGEVPQRQSTIQAGAKGDIPLPGNYFGDGVRLAVFRPSNHTWYIKGKGNGDWNNSAGNVEIKFAGYKEGDIPVPGNYGGDGITRLAFFRPSEGNWYIKGYGPSSWADSQGNLVIQAGTNGDIPVPADYTGAGHTQIAVYRPSNHTWYIKGPGFSHWNESKGNTSFVFAPTAPEEDDVPVPADYYGERKARAAFWRPKDGTWWIKGAGFAGYKESQGNVTVQCGTRGDIPLPADYYGEGKARIAVYRPSAKTWFIKGPGYADWASSPNNASVLWGSDKDPEHKPVSAHFGL